MIYSELKSIKALTTEKKELQAKIATKENNIKTYCQDKLKWFIFFKNLFTGESTTSSSLGIFSAGYKIIGKIINVLRNKFL